MELADLYRAHWRSLCNYIRAQFGGGPPDPEDIAQTAFARLAATDAEILNPQAFLYTAARHIAIDHHRHDRRGEAQAHKLEFQAIEDFASELSPENVLLQGERFQILAEALERLPLTQRRLVLLNRFEGLSYRDIGQRFGMSAESVRKHIERTLAECRRALESAQRPSLRTRSRVQGKWQ